MILQTASTNGVMGYPYYADYNATKAGVIELTRSMALELAPRVRVCAVAPGYVLTPMQRAEYSDAMLDEVNQKIPLGRHAKPEEIAGLFAYLASDDAAYVTGHVFTMDGGETAGGLASRGAQRYFWEGAALPGRWLRGCGWPDTTVRLLSTTAIQKSCGLCGGNRKWRLRAI